MRAHPYAIAIAAVLLLSAFTGVVLEERGGSSIARDNASFSTGETSQEGAVYVRQGTVTHVPGVTEPSAPTMFFSPAQQGPSAMPAPASAATGTAALERLRDYLASLEPASSASATAAPLDLSSIYQYVPGARSAGTSANAYAAALSSSAGDSALHAYGNAAGAYVSAFETVSAEQQDALQDFFDAPSDATAAAVTADADAMETLAQALAGMAGVPPAAQMIHENLAAAYRVAAGKLRAIGSARSDADLTSAVTAYDASAQALGSAFVAMVSFFSAQGVSFGADEAGHVFMYTASL